MKLKIPAILFLTLALGHGAFAQNEVSKIDSHLEGFSRQLTAVIPNAAVQTNTYADAWIGKFVPSLPMHFAVGIDGSVTQLDIKDLSNAAKMTGIYSIPDSFLFPTINFNARLGGIFLPFDAGFSFSMVDTEKLGRTFEKIDFEYFAIGGDLRYALLKGIGPLPQLSVGAGYYYVNTSIGKSAGSQEVKSSSTMQAIVAEAQVSKTIIFFTPFIGFRGIWSEADSSYSWKSSAGLNNGMTVVHSGSGSVKTEFKDSFIPQIFGGFGFKIGTFELDATGSYDFKNEIWSAGASIRFKL
ncbi:MAG: hypothetical protein K6E69_03480 [Treponema sp.]|uniref:hypothetical protein n=1 Tax=Treponema sp. TaxID=166 RepID=UPI00298EA727|nr:hypothetical protein [Treponema sp.]MCR5386161.1 hypothetical protein [Treponema sp.]